MTKSYKNTLVNISDPDNKWQEDKNIRQVTAYYNSKTNEFVLNTPISRKTVPVKPAILVQGDKTNMMVTFYKNGSYALSWKAVPSIINATKDKDLVLDFKKCLKAIRSDLDLK